ncbi:MAG: DUF2279 domain-containing protein [Ignavibacteriales bacterium]|nr:DUF2279 domain-containing protein [Ignavibacteriales bacterium]
MKKFTLTIFLLTTFATAQQSAEQDSLFLSMPRKDFAAYTTLAWSAGAVFMEFQWWWRDDYMYKQHEFRIANDGFFNNYSYGVDKLGHLFTSYLFFHTTYDFLKWAHFDEKTAVISAVAVPLAHAVAIELADGYSKYAFNPPDLIFNSTGILYGVLQSQYTFLRNFNLKWSYIPTEAYNRPNRDWGPASDYTGHIYWIAMDVHNLLPESAQQYWPKFLNLAVGMGAKNVSFGDTGEKKHKFAISLDWKMTELPLYGDTWEVIKNLIDKVHFPAPGIKIHTGEKPQGKVLLLN